MKQLITKYIWLIIIIGIGIGLFPNFFCSSLWKPCYDFFSRNISLSSNFQLVLLQGIILLIFAYFPEKRYSVGFTFCFIAIAYICIDSISLCGISPVPNIAFFIILLSYPLIVVFTEGYKLFANRKNYINENKGWSIDKPVGISGDSLKRKEIAKEVVKHIMNTKSPTSSCTIAIQGKWGSGKSSFLKMIEEYLQSNHQEQSIVVHLNPWLQKTDYETIQEILRVYEDAIGSQNEYLQGSIRELATALSTDNPYFYLKSILFFISRFRKRSTSEIKNTINEILQKKEQKLVVFCDDLDRMDEEEIRSFFKIIRGILDWGSTYFVVGMDETQVLKTIKKEKDPSFLKKFFQVSYFLPKIEEPIFYHLLINKIKTEFYQDMSSLFEYKIGNSIPYLLLGKILSMRDINLILNSLKISHGMLRDEVDFETLTLLEILKFYYPDLYSYMVKSSKSEVLSLVSTREAISSSNIYSVKEFQENLIKNIDNKFFTGAAELLQDLLNTNKDCHAPIGDVENYDLYFTHIYPKRRVSESVIQQIIQTTNEQTVIRLFSELKEIQVQDFFERAISNRIAEIRLTKSKYKILLDKFCQDSKFELYKSPFNVWAEETSTNLEEADIDDSFILSCIDEQKHLSLQGKVDHAYSFLRSYKTRLENAKQKFKEAFKHSPEISANDYRAIFIIILQNVPQNEYDSHANDLKKIFQMHIKEKPLLVFGSMITKSRNIPNHFILNEQFDEILGSNWILTKVNELLEKNHKVTQFYNSFFSERKTKGSGFYGVDFDFSDAFEQPHIYNLRAKSLA